MVSGGVDGGQELQSGDWYVYCAGVGHIIPGCGFKLEADNEKMARKSLILRKEHDHGHEKT